MSTASVDKTRAADVEGCCFQLPYHALQQWAGQEYHLYIIVYLKAMRKIFDKIFFCTKKIDLPGSYMFGQNPFFIIWNKL